MTKQFHDKLNVAVLTTVFVMRQGSWILHVAHHEDGFWEFSGNEAIDQDEDILIVSLREIIERDPSVTEVADLPHGFRAEREDSKSEWQVYRLEQDV